MKVFILMAVVVAARCASLHYAPVAVAETGASTQFRSEDNLGNYNFGYNEDHTSGGTFRRETGDAHGNVAGSYGLRDADGRIRIVNYVANDDGFKADIQTNEPGVEPKDPADATINKAETVLLHSAVPVASVLEPVVAIPQAIEPVAAPLTYAFPAPAAIPVAKSVATTYTFPEPSPIPVAKTVSTVAVAESHPVAYTFPEPAAIPVAVAQPAPLTYAFPAPAAVPVAKSVAVAHPAPLNYAFPAPAATVAVAQPAPLTYAFPAPAAVPVAKSVAVAHPAPLNYAFPAPAATVAVAQPAPLNYAFPAPAAIPVAKSVAVAQPAPLTYAFPAPAAVPVAKSSYSSQVVVNNAPLAYQAAPLHYGASPIHSAFRYASPYYRTLYSPAVSTFAGPVPYFNNIEYHGYPVVKK